MNKLWLSVLLFSLLLSVTSGNEEADSTDAPDTIMDSTTIEITTIETNTIKSTTVPINLTLITSTLTSTSIRNQSDLVKQSPDTQFDETDKEGNINIFGLYVLIFFSGFLLAIVLVVTVIGFKKFRRYRLSSTSVDLAVIYVNQAFEDGSKPIQYLPGHTSPMIPPLP